MLKFQLAFLLLPICIVHPLSQPSNFTAYEHVEPSCKPTPAAPSIQALARFGLGELLNAPECARRRDGAAAFCAGEHEMVGAYAARAQLCDGVDGYRMEVAAYESTCPLRKPTGAGACRLRAFADGVGGVSCRMYVPSWSYVGAGAGAGQCVRFVYGGCGGNDNRFGSKADCEATCGGGAQPPRPHAGCEQEPGVIGPCRAAMPRWTYNAETRTCERFIYGGCRGNDNRFRSRLECINACVPNEPRAARKDAMVMPPERRCEPLAGGRRFTCWMTATRLPKINMHEYGGPQSASAGGWRYDVVPPKCTMAVQRNGYWKEKVLGQLERAEQMIRDKL